MGNDKFWVFMSWFLKCLKASGMSFSSEALSDDRENSSVQARRILRNEMYKELWGAGWQERKKRNVRSVKRQPQFPYNLLSKESGLDSQNMVHGKVIGVKHLERENCEQIKLKWSGWVERNKVKVYSKAREFPN